MQIDKGTGGPIVLLHGLGTNYKSWSYVLRALDYKKSHVIALDLLGFGDAPKPKNSDYTPADHAEAVIATLDKLNITDAVVAGHSMGCIVAIEVAKRRPDIAKRLVLLGAPLYQKLPRHTLWGKLTRTEGAYFTIFSFLKANPDLTITAAQNADKLLPFLKGMEITEATWPAFRKSLNNTIMQFESYKGIQKLKTPTLLVCGVLDVFVIRRNLKRIVRANKQYCRFKTALGPHEITPLQGRKVAAWLQQH